MPDGGVHVAAGLGWRGRILRLRDRVLSSAEFRRQATRFPLTRPVARRRARALFDLCAGFVYSQVLLALVRLQVPQILRDAPLTAPELAARVQLSPAAAERLLLAAVSLRLLSHRPGGRFGLGPLGSALIENPGLIAMIDHHDMLYDDLRDPVLLLRGELRDPALQRYWPYADAGAGPLTRGQTGAYTGLMAASQPMIASEVLDAYPLARHRCLLDVGGGSGAFVTAALAGAGRLRGIVFDLEPVAAVAREHFAAAGIGDRAIAVGGDFLRDPLPEGADVVSLIRVLHDHDDGAALALLRAVRAALPADGTLLLAEPMAETDGAGPVGDAYFGFYLLAMGSGRPRRRAEIDSLLRQAGFSRTRWLRTRTPLLVRLVVAQS